MDSELLRTVLAGVPLPLILIDSEQRVRGLNPLAAELLAPAAEGRLYLTVLRQPAILDCIEGTLRHRQRSETRQIISGPTQEATYLVQVAPIAGGGVLVSFSDITDMEQAGQMRRDFVANVSHELRTPLTALLGFIETLRGAARDDPAARDRFLAIMEREANRMNRLVSDLLSLSRVEGQERVRPAGQIDLAQQLNGVVTSLRPIAQDAGCEIILIGAEAPVMVRADADQMTQVFNNLIENALKYGGPEKTVTVTLKREQKDSLLRRPAVRVAVKDEGEGIEPTHLPRLTERFYRIDNHRSREQGGTGLGLAIVKHIVNRHRGRFRIESEKGKGSCFTVVLPEE